MYNSIHIERVENGVVVRCEGKSETGEYYSHTYVGDDSMFDVIGEKLGDKIEEQDHPRLTPEAFDSRKKYFR